MIGIKQLMNLAKGGGLGPDELGELMAAAGMEVEMSTVTDAGRAGAFQRAAHTTQADGSKVFAISGRTKTGERLEAILVIAPAG